MRKISVLIVELLCVSVAVLAGPTLVSHTYSDGTEVEIPLYLFVDTWDEVPGVRIATHNANTFEVDGAQPSHVKHAWYHGADVGGDFAVIDTQAIWALIEATYWVDLYINGAIVVPHYVEVGSSELVTEGDDEEVHWWVRWIFEFPAHRFEQGIYIFTVVWTSGGRSDSPITRSTTVSVLY